VVPEAELEVTLRRCCCTPPTGEGCCFSFSVTATHYQDCKLECTVITCDRGFPEPCESSQSFGVVNTYTSNPGPVGPQQFVVSTAPPPFPSCDCYGDVCTYTWTPGTITFTRTVYFALGCTGPIPQNTPTGDIAVGRRDAPACPSLLFCNCCGVAGDPSVVTIGYTGTIPPQTVSGDCGDATYNNGYPAPYAWTTSYYAHYCWDPDSPCTMTLVALDVQYIKANPSFGPDAFLGGDCDCGTNDAGVCNPVTAARYCAPFTGLGATIYGLAGSPPMTITGTPCPCA
jgi:hypothetical protein